MVFADMEEWLNRQIEGSSSALIRHSNKWAEFEPDLTARLIGFFVRYFGYHTETSARQPEHLIPDCLFEGQKPFR
jgi:hypothetical protein